MILVVFWCLWWVDLVVGARLRRFPRVWLLVVSGAFSWVF